MRKNFSGKQRAPMLYPQPVCIIAAYGEDGTPNAMNVAWGGVCDYDKLFFAVAADHKTTKNILKRKAFTVSMATADFVKECDYLGIVSGNSVPDKMARAGFRCEASAFVDAPLIAELPLAIECELISFDPATDYLIGRIVNVSADERILDENGQVDPTKLRPITFDPVHMAYRVLGEAVGKAFSDGKALK